jgi:hypothetical protein
MTELTYEHHFVTQDIDSDGKPVVFGMVEDEDGGTYWGYGHIDRAEFIAEINRWLSHCGLFEDELIAEDETVDHRWARFADDERYGERFELVAESESVIPPDAFPVTRVWV